MPEKILLEMNGTVEQIVYRNEKNQYTVLEMNNGEELVTVVGCMPFLSVGEELHVIGTWGSHPSFGPQFKAQICERSRPATAAAMLKYLSSGAVKGIGPAMAARLVEKFGENVLKVLEEDPERLSAVRGISREKAGKIAEEFRRVSGIRTMMTYLSQYGLTAEEAVRVYRLYGEQTRERIENDPYCLCREELGFDFIRADGIAQNMNMPEDASCRVQAGVLFVLRHNTGNGHTCLPRGKLLSASARMLGVELETAESALDELVSCGDLQEAELGGQDLIFLSAYFEAEIYAAQRLQVMLEVPPKAIVDVDASVSQIEKESGITYAQEQKQAIRLALQNGLLLLTGGPGTGKTTTLNAVIRILKSCGQTVLLAAPTGRAAKRMAEVTGEDAKTIHRMLQVAWDAQDRPVFMKNERDPLECDALIVDELSMVDSQLFAALLRALPLSCRLILVGDCEQLPSVGAGNVLGDLLASGLFPTVQLREIFRQSMQSLIVTNAHRIVHGEMPVLNRHDNDFFYLPFYESGALARTIIDLCVRRLPKSYGYSIWQDIQVLCPGRKGELGTIEMNRRLQEVLNPAEKGKREIKVDGMILREGDKVMQIKNDYDLPWSKEDGTTGEGIFNGDVGILTEVDKKGGSLTVMIDEKEVLYDLDHAGELELAYAMTIHKSQGNEFPAVILPMFPGPKQLSYRNLLYTAITRAKNLLILVGEKECIYQMVENNRKTKRYSALCLFLTGGEKHA